MRIHEYQLLRLLADNETDRSFVNLSVLGIPASLAFGYVNILSSIAAQYS
jgi:hypothetical protein